MTDSEKKVIHDFELIVDKENYYVTEEGALYVKSNSLFEERKIGELNPEDPESDLKGYRARFSKLEKKVRTELTALKEQPGLDSHQLNQKVESLKEELKAAEAVGDFDALADILEKDYKDINERIHAAAASDEPDKKVKDRHPEEDISAPDENTEPVAEAKAEAEEKTALEPESIEEPGPQAETNKSKGQAETSGGSKSDSEEPETSDEPGQEDANEVDQYYRELAEKAEQLIELTDWPYVSLEFGNIDSLWAEGPDPVEVDINPYRKRIDEARDSFEKKKQAHYEEQKRIREENLEKKKALLTELKEIVEKEKWTATKDVGRIRNRWEQLKPIPKEAEEQLEASFNKLIEEFEDHKVDRLVRKKQKEEENLIGKLVILDKMDGLLKKLDDSVSDWKNAEEDLNRLNKQWHKIGRVPIDKNQETWDRYHDIQDRFHKLRFKHDKKYRQQIEKFLSKKKQLIKEAEALVDYEDLADAARKVNKLHRRWKKVGNLPQKDENELWDQFKAATDAFNKKKSENIDQLRAQEDENLEEKMKLIRKAEELQDSEEWEATHDRMQQLMKQWKEAGPVPKRKSGKIWKQFKGAMDVFYDRRREHFKEVREDRKENLEKKREILDKLKALKDHENPIQAVEEAKPLQEAFKKAGYVPIKHKNKMWKEYRETCDVIYDRFRAAKSAASVVGKENVSDFSADDIAEIQKKQKQAGKLRKEISKLSKEVIQMKESLSYFKPSGKGSSLLDEVHNKIEKAEMEIEEKENLLDELERQIDQLKRDS